LNPPPTTSRPRSHDGRRRRGNSCAGQHAGMQEPRTRRREAPQVVIRWCRMS
jgi:hypothetical protein